MSTQQALTQTRFRIRHQHETNSDVRKLLNTLAELPARVRCPHDLSIRLWTI